MLTKEERFELELLLKKEQKNRAKNNLFDFTKYTLNTFDGSDFHKNYYDVLDRFCNKEIKRLIVSIPPQHGKSEGSSKRLPAFLFGKNPDLNIALASYNSTFAKKFNRQIQRIITSQEYKSIFKETSLSQSKVVSSAQGTWLRNSEEFEIVGKKGSFKAVGVGGGLTGNSVDIMIMDDLYKDYQDATSPIVSQSVWEWYITVVRTRLHNDSQELIVFTRWDENDVVGRLEKKGLVVNYDGDEGTISNLRQDQFLKINFEAIKESDPTKIDNRKKGEPLWAKKHSLKSLEDTRELDPGKFSALHQGQPRSKEGLMYGNFKTYIRLPELKIIKSYSDTADTGKDNLCSIVYGVPLDSMDKNIYVIDVYFSDQSMEITEPAVANMLTKNNSRRNIVESNNGGRGFARSVDKLTGNNINIKWFHQSENKFSRIFSNSASVNSSVIMPYEWELKFKEFYNAISDYKKDGSTKHDDAPDALTGCYETEFVKKPFYVD